MTISAREKLQKWIHGKKFWELHVSQKMAVFFGQESRIKYANEIWKHRSLPEDWNEIWSKLSKFQPHLKEKVF